MPNEENLIRNEDLTPDERRERASKAGKASGVSRRRSRKLKDTLKLLMQLPPDSPEAKEALAGLGADLDCADNQTAMVAGLMKKAMKGDSKAMKELRNILGESRDTAIEAKERKARIDKLNADTEARRKELTSGKSGQKESNLMKMLTEIPEEDTDDLHEVQ